jgi:hypothetical protein
VEKPVELTREVTEDGWRVRLDVSRQVLHLDVPSGWDEPAPLLPRLPADERGFVSAALLMLKAKQFDDGLYAAVELAAQSSAGRFAGKAKLLAGLADALAGETVGPGGDALALVLGACLLGGVPVRPLVGAESGAEVLVEAFLGDEAGSKPLGFYTRSPALVAIFRQDRFLQQELTDPAVVTALAGALERDAQAGDTYAAYLRLVAGLTNPFLGLDVRVPLAPVNRLPGAAPEARHFIPPSRSHEVDLFQRLYADTPVPDGFNLMDELIRRIRSGEVRLEPNERSGWYDYQTWALEPLVRPESTWESDRLQLGRRYREHLVDLFKGSLALTRETHAKQAGGGRGGYGGPRIRPIYVRPGLTVEPLATCYHRRALGYRFVRTVLEQAFGAEALNGLRWRTADGSVVAPLGEALAAVESLFRGAYATSCREIGLAHGLPNVGQDEARFSRWADNLAADPDVAQDARMMVPVFYDVGRRKMKVWVFLGWERWPASVTFVSRPCFLSCHRPNGERTEPPPIEFIGETHALATPVTAEVYVERLLDRNEFRAHCDRHRTRQAILARLR